MLCFHFQVEQYFFTDMQAGKTHPIDPADVKNGSIIMFDLTDIPTQDDFEQLPKLPRTPCSMFANYHGPHVVC